MKTDKTRIKAMQQRNKDDNNRRELWKAIYNDKDFIKFASEFRPLVLTQENKLMTAAPWTPYKTN